MKQFKVFWLFFIPVFAMYAHANSELGVIDCSLKGSGSCDIFMKMDRGVDDVSYKVKLADSKSEKGIFPYTDMNETMESVSLQKYGGNYVFSKEYLDSSKSIEFISFKYEDEEPAFIKYYYIESSIDVNNSALQWSGKVCDTSAGVIPEEKGVGLLQAASGICINKMKLAYSPNKVSGTDVIFYLSQVTNGEVKEQIPVIALDRKDVDILNLADIGCLNDCNKAATSIDYIGRLNKKIRVGMHLDYNGNDISGYYFYNITKKKINITGRKSGEKLVLSASLPEGEETFDGTLAQGQFKGIWSNAAGSKKYPFEFYMMLVQ